MSFPESSPLKKIPKQEPTTRAIRQIRRIMTTATHPPAAMAAIKPFTAAIVVLTAVTVAWIAAFTPVTVAFAAALAAWADALTDFAVACAVFCAVLAACCAAFDERCAVLIPLTLCFKLFTDRPAVFTTFCGLPLTQRNCWNIISTVNPRVFIGYENNKGARHTAACLLCAANGWLHRTPNQAAGLPAAF